jgi:hypothetical protein
MFIYSKKLRQLKESFTRAATNWYDDEMIFDVSAQLIAQTSHQMNELCT